MTSELVTLTPKDTLSERDPGEVLGLDAYQEAVMARELEEGP